MNVTSNFELAQIHYFYSAETFRTRDGMHRYTVWRTKTLNPSGSITGIPSRWHFDEILFITRSGLN